VRFLEAHAPAPSAWRKTGQGTHPSPACADPARPARSGIRTHWTQYAYIRNGGIDHKTVLFTRIIPTLKDQSAYFVKSICQESHCPTDDAALCRWIHPEISCRESRESGWNAWANPNKSDVEQFVLPCEKTIILI